jgi:hypothetical protein
MCRVETAAARPTASTSALRPVPLRLRWMAAVDPFATARRYASARRIAAVSIRSNIWRPGRTDASRRLRRLWQTLRCQSLERADHRGRALGTREAQVRYRAAGQGADRGREESPRGDTAWLVQDGRAADAMPARLHLNARSSRRGLRAARWRFRIPTSSRRPRGASRWHPHGPSARRD